MAYNASLDKCLSASEILVGDEIIILGVYSYNDGQPKIRLQRKAFNRRTGAPCHRKIGGMTVQEASAISAAIVSALTKMSS